MKIIASHLCLFLGSIFYFSCTKPADPVAPPVKPPVDTTAKVLYPLSFTERYFDYPFIYNRTVTLSFDAGKQLAGVRFVEHDTASTTIVADSSLLTFYTSTGKNAPNSYDYLRLGSSYQPVTGHTESHVLTYDVQGRIVQDSLTNPIDLSAYSPVGYKMAFSYAAGLTTITGIDKNIYVGEFPFFYDSLFTSSGQLSNWKHYMVGDMDSSTQKNYTYQHGHARNPLYNASLAASIGPLLQYYLQADLLSSTTQTSVSFYVNKHVVTFVRAYTPTTDSSGNVVQLSGIDARLENVPGDVWNFRY